VNNLVPTMYLVMLASGENIVENTQFQLGVDELWVDECVKLKSV